MRRKLNNRGFWTAFIVLGVFGAGALVLGNLWLDDANTTLIGVLKTIGVFIDCQIYSVAAWAYSIFYELSSSSLLNSLNLAGASQRLYTLLGIFMLFRLAFSFVKYIINPDGMEKGTSKLVTNLAISLALIVSVPWIFNRAFALQSYIMESNVIGNLIMGMNTSKDGEDNFNASSYGQNISFLTFSAFYRPNTSISVLSPCSNLLTYYTKYVVPSGDKTVTVDPGNKKEDDPVIIESKKIAQCVNALNGNDNSLGAIEKNGADVEIGTMFYIASQRQSIGMFSNSALLSAKIGNDAVISYTAIVSAIAGGFLALLFLNFSFDVAIRNVKLCFLQIIAPIPIILNIEPGDAKADKKPLNWWIKECLRTYTDLFVRIATIYFGVFLINELFGGGVTTGNSNNSPWFQVFMILGILLFVKQVPDMIGKAFGIDVKGQFNLNPLKRIGDSRLASMAVGGAAGLVGGLGTGIAAFNSARANKAGFGEALRRGVTGGIGGTLHSGISGAKKGAKSLHDITGNTRENLARSGRIAGANVGTTWGGRVGAKIATATGAPTKFDNLKKESESLESYANNFNSMRDFAQSSKENIGIERFTGGGYKVTSSQALDKVLLPELRKQKASAKASGNSAEEARLAALIKGYDTKAVRSSLDAGTFAITNGKTTGDSFTTVKDAKDYVDRLKASGASVAEIKAAEDMLSNFTNNSIDTFKDNRSHAIGAMWANGDRIYTENEELFSDNHVARALDAAELKAQITAAKNAATSIKLDPKTQRAEREKNAATAGRK